MRFNTYNLLCVIFVAFGTMSTAYGIAIIGSTSGQPNFYSYFGLATAGEPDYAHTSSVLGGLNGANSGGGVVGCAISAWTADRFGRKMTMIIGSLFIILGGALNAGSVSIGMFAAGRVLAGVGSGILAIVTPMYQGEVSTAETRGMMMCVTGIMYAWGYSFAGWLGYACAHIPGTSPNASAAWRFPLAFQCVPPLIVILGSKFIPESPRWLLSRDRQEESFTIIKKLHATKDDAGELRAKEEFYLMEKQHEADKQLKLDRPFEIFRTAPNRKRAATAMVLMFFNQMIGAYVLANYGVLIYGSLGLSDYTSLLLNACWTTYTIFGNTGSALLVDRVGRKPLLLIGTIGCLSALVLEAALTAVYLGSTNTAALNACIFFLWWFITFWAFCIDATQYVYVSEIWPNHLRSQGTALGVATFFAASCITLVAAPIALNAVGWKFYLVLICPTTLYIPIQYFFFPETKGRTLEEIGVLFGDTNVAARWYGISDAEKEEIQRNALRLTETGHIKGDVLDVEGKSVSGTNGDSGHLEKEA